MSTKHKDNYMGYLNKYHQLILDILLLISKFSIIFLYRFLGNIEIIHHNLMLEE